MIKKIAMMLMLVSIGLLLGGCVMGFNSNGFYCTEGPRESAPACF